MRNSKCYDAGMVSSNDADKGLISLGLELPPPVTPFGEYAETVQIGNLLFLTGALPVLGHDVKYRGRIGAEFDTDAGPSRNTPCRAERPGNC
jgi:hypothetical protein